MFLTGKITNLFVEEQISFKSLCFSFKTDHWFIPGKHAFDNTQTYPERRKISPQCSKYGQKITPCAREVKLRPPQTPRYHTAVMFERFQGALNNHIWSLHKSQSEVTDVSQQIFRTYIDKYEYIHFFVSFNHTNKVNTHYWTTY